MCISGIYSLETDLKEENTTISTSAVEIDLKEYDINNNEFTDNGKVVMPGEEIAFIPKVNNLGVDCYLRAKITYTIDNNSYNELDYIDGNYKSWDKRDGYYYYNPVFSKSTSLEIFNKVTIPSNLPASDLGKKVIISIIVEAIQARNFDGNWDGIEIKESIERNYDINGGGSSVVVFVNNSKDHIDVDDNYFDNLGSLLPGDSISEEVKIVNRSKSLNDYYLSIEYDNLTQEEKNLLKNINLTITSNNKKIVSKDLFSINKELLCTLKKNEKDTLLFTISLPKDLDNDFSKILTKIVWKFSLEVRGQENTIINPQTWDLKFDLSMIIFLLSALGLLIVIILERIGINNKKEGEKNYE
jgi:hypothetical protein